MIRILILLIAFCNASSFASEIESNCQVSNDIKTNKVTFYIGQSVKKIMSDKDVQLWISNAINLSNEILSNSCIPLRREVEAIVYIDDINPDYIDNISLTHIFLESTLNRELDNSDLTKYYGYVYYLDSNCGLTDASKYPKFFLLNLFCAQFTLEHELGHLATANHDIKTLQSQNYVYTLEIPFSNFKEATYARGAICDGHGTIMSYVNPRVFTYSSPDISLNGHPCGEENKADNAKVLRSYVRKFYGN